MIFTRLPVAQAAGAILAHSVKLPSRTLSKGKLLTSADLALLREGGQDWVTVARLEDGEMPEDEAAAQLAAALAGEGVGRQAAFTGRCNLFATVKGLALIHPKTIRHVNLVDESITVATAPPYEPVEPGQLLATVKIIPFAAPRAAVEHCRGLAEAGRLAVAPFRRHQAGLVLTRLPQTKPSVIEKTIEATRHRLEAMGSQLAATVDCPHDQAEVAAAVAGLLERGLDPILISGASAIVDRRDVIPAGIVAAGGVIDHFGMPVDPGNLLLLAHHGSTRLVCLPGCARSTRLNGFDFVLRRVLAGLEVGAKDLARMAIGGLLSEIPSRPSPRQGLAAAEAPRAPRIAALVMAAGRSSRMGSNKLLAEVAGKPMLLHAVDAALASAARPVVVVTGHEADEIARLVDGRDVQLVHNPDYREGMSGSLRAGLAALPADCDGALICLADMPGVEAGHLERLIAAFNPAEGRAIIVPMHGDHRGNPVLWAARFFPEMSAIKGDVGARHLIGEYRELVREVPFEDTGVLLDIDTPDRLAATRGTLP